MNIFYKMKHGTEYLNYGRDIIVDYCKKSWGGVKKNGRFKILDLGAGSGTDLFNCLKELKGNVELFALESYAPNVEKLKKKGVCARNFNIEKDSFQVENESIDFIIMNQDIMVVKAMLGGFVRMSVI